MIIRNADTGITLLADQVLMTNKEIVLNMCTYDGSNIYIVLLILVIVYSCVTLYYCVPTEFKSSHQ